jgi:hypothetical protein
MSERPKQKALRAKIALFTSALYTIGAADEQHSNTLNTLDNTNT